MPHIVLNAEQLAIIATSLDPIEIRDNYGTVLAMVAPHWTREDIERAKEMLADPNTKWFTSEQVMAHLRSLEKQ